MPDIDILWLDIDILRLDVDILWLDILQNYIFAPWSAFHSTVNQCILNSYAMIIHYHYERLGYFDDQLVLYLATIKMQGKVAPLKSYY